MGGQGPQGASPPDALGRADVRLGGDLLDRLAEELERLGGRAPLAEVAARSLASDNGPLAARLLAGMVDADPRFALSRADGILRLAPRRSRPEDVDLQEAAFAVMDFETNGLPPQDRAVEVGVACFRGGREEASFETLVDPGTPISPFVSRLTGIRPEDLRGKPGFESVWPDLEGLLRGRVVVAHNLPFDGRVLRREVRLCGGDHRIADGGLCTLRLARRLLPKDERKGLDELAVRFGFTFRSRHRALDDARVAGRVLYRLIDMAREVWSVRTLGDLRARLEAPPGALDGTGSGGAS